MANKEYIPTLIPSEMDRFHADNTNWTPNISTAINREYHINKLDIITQKSSFQVLPHRKTVHDFIFLKKGTSIRSKGLNKYEFGASSIFLLPAYQITQHEMISDDAEGFYCHFDEKIFEFLPKNYLSEQFSFFQFQSNPVIQLSEETLNTIEFILNRMLEIYKTGNDSNKNLIAYNLLVIFEELKKELPFQIKQTKNSFFEITERYKNKLSQHIYKYQNISDYANFSIWQYSFSIPT